VVGILQVIGPKNVECGLELGDCWDKLRMYDMELTRFNESQGGHASINRRAEPPPVVISTLDPRSMFVKPITNHQIPYTLPPLLLPEIWHPNGFSSGKPRQAKEGASTLNPQPSTLNPQP